jgi:polyhydroxyalkanoate synthesis repressor PhaR
MMTIVKKYANRRLYDTAASRYVTLEELADKIRRGDDVQVLDAATNEDLTQSTLAQIILESRGASKLLPVPLLVQLIRMGDEALAEFMGRFLTTALELYLQARQGAQQIAPYNPFATLPFAATNALARMFTGGSMWGEPAPRPAAPPPPPPSHESADVADLRRELEELKRAMKKQTRKK